MVLNRDTIIAITIAQAKEINVNYLEFGKCRQINDSLLIQVKDYEKMLYLQDSIVILYKGQQKVLEKKNKIYEDTLIETNKTVTSQEKQIKKLKLTKKFFIGVSFLVTLSYLLK